MNKADQIRKIVADHGAVNFTVNDIKQVTTPDISKHYIQSRLVIMVRKGEICRLARQKGLSVIYSNPKPKAPHHKIYPDKPQDVDSNNLSIAKIGESIYIFIETLKKQIYTQKETIEKLRQTVSTLRKENSSYQSVSQDQQKALEILRTKINQQNGKTMKLSEVARVIQTGNLLD